MLTKLPVLKFVPPILTLGCCIAIAFAAQGTVELEHNWGFEVVKSLIGQLDDSGQWLGALLLQGGAVPAMASGLCFGYMKQHFKGSKKWYFIPLALMFWPCLTLLVESILERNIVHEMIGLAGPVCIINLLIFTPCMFIGQSLFRELQKRTHPWRLFLPGFAALGFLWSSHFGPDLVWTGQFAIDAASILAASCAVVYLNKGSSLSKAFLCTLFTLLPFVFFNLANVLFDLMPFGEFSLLMTSGSHGARAIEQETIRALFSAIIITCSHFICALLGMTLGVVFSRAKEARTHN